MKKIIVLLTYLCTFISCNSPIKIIYNPSLNGVFTNRELNEHYLKMTFDTIHSNVLIETMVDTVYFMSYKVSNDTIYFSNGISVFPSKVIELTDSSFVLDRLLGYKGKYKFYK